MKKAITIFLLFILNQPAVRAYDSYNVHPQINEKASRQAERLPSALKDIGFNNGIDSVVDGKKIYLWFREGGIKEDSPTYRANSHFHDPLKAWSEAGLAGSNLGISSLIWAQDQRILGPTAGGDWSWAKARNYYYEALTFVDINSKEQKFADTFRSLGQVMHLLSDSSVPAHTRNDIHVFPLELFGVTFGKRQTYESWAQKNWRKLDYSAKTVDLSLFKHAVYDAAAPAALSALWDQNQYNGSNPEVTWTTNAAISDYGLSEFTNANFFSEDTIFKDYPHPAKENTTAKLVEQDARDGKHDIVWYIQSYTSERLAAYSYFNKWLLPDQWEYNLDDFVYADYASLLIPRAVGYSAGLLNYFFRGSIAISLPNSGIFASTDDRNIGFTRITLLASNISTNGDEMTDGSIELVARYRTLQDDPFQPFDLQASNDYVYVVVPEAGGRRSIPKGSPVELVFDRGQTAIIPVNAVDVSLQIVYHGKLGNEDGAVAVGLQSISDPTPVELVNNMDKICLNGNWYDAGSQAAINQVDPEHDGIANWDIYSHDLQNIYVKVSPGNDPVQASSSDFTFASAILSARGEPMRAYILSESEVQLNHSHAATVVKTAASDVFAHVSDIFDGIWPGYVVKSDIETSEDAALCSSYGFSTPCTIRHAPPFYSFKGKYLWGPMTTIFDNPKYPTDTSCDWQALK